MGPSQHATSKITSPRLLERERGRLRPGCSVSVTETCSLPSDGLGEPLFAARPASSGSSTVSLECAAGFGELDLDLRLCGGQKDDDGGLRRL